MTERIQLCADVPSEMDNEAPGPGSSQVISRLLALEAADLD